MLIPGPTPKRSSPSGGAGGWPVVALLAITAACAVLLLSACGSLALPLSSPTPTPTVTLTPAPTPTPSLAKQLLAFGSEGKDPGELNWVENIGVDQDGNIYVANSEDGRINIFDSAGKFLRLINLGEDSVVEGMGVAPDGTIYACYDSQLLKLDARGRGTPLVYTHNGKSDAYCERYVAVGADGSVVIMDNDDQIVRFNPDGKVTLVIEQVFTPIIGFRDGNIRIAVDQQGNIYVFGYNSGIVLKYSPKGEFIHQFGGSTPDDNGTAITPGRFSIPLALAVDGNGRIFVSDRLGVQVFSPNFKYLNSFKISGSAFGMIFDANNNLYIAANYPQQVVVMAVQKPQ